MSARETASDVSLSAIARSSTRRPRESPVALREIKLCVEQSENNLYLSELGLTSDSLPPQIWDMTHLRWLNLCDNEIQALPPEIGKLVSTNAGSMMVTSAFAQISEQSRFAASQLVCKRPDLPPT
jgi:hypothetical protein